MAIKVARPNQLGEIYDNVLARSFPPAELVDRAGFLTYTTWGEVLVTGEEQIEGVAVGDHSAATGLMMVDYLAMAPESRQEGHGSELFATARERWVELLSPGAFLAELERPDAHPASEAYGDPERRLRFYQRLGVRALAVPYYQPAVAPGQPPVPDLLLGILVEDPSWVVGDLFVQGERVAALLVERNPSPTPAELPAHEALLASLRDPAGVELVDLDDYQRIARSGPVG
ncbi:MAG TPA: hypothetical protein PLE12_07365 [Propionicimonas sp.]|jgi:GNAT superfamily N-acetyltransferase|nr:hypothetical protein [Propionicimonas sp.]